MKLSAHIATAAVFALLITGCADKFLTAKIAVTSGRAAMSMSQIGLDTASKAKKEACNVPICKKLDPSQGAKYQECMKQDHSADAEWVSCYAKFKKFYEQTWPQVTKVAGAGFDTADQSIKVAEDGKAGLPIDVMPVIKASACLVAQALEFLPEDIKKKVQMFLDMMKAFGCSQPSP